jgi:hypothetical protein
MMQLKIAHLHGMPFMITVPRNITVSGLRAAISSYLSQQYAIEVSFLYLPCINPLIWIPVAGSTAATTAEATSSSVRCFFQVSTRKIGLRVKLSFHLPGRELEVLLLLSHSPLAASIYIMRGLQKAPCGHYMVFRLA